MSRREAKARATGPGRHGGLRAYLHRFFTSWVAEDPDPTYSALDLDDGLGQDPDPVCQPRAQLPESDEVTHQAWRVEETRRPVAGRHAR